MDQRRDEHDVWVARDEIVAHRRILWRTPLEPADQCRHRLPRPPRVAIDEVTERDKRSWRALARPLPKHRRVVEQPMLIAQGIETVAGARGDPSPFVFGGGG